MKKHFLLEHLNKQGDEDSNKNQNLSENASKLNKKSKPKSCSYCEEILEDRRAYKIHINTLHPDVKDHVCSECGSAYKHKCDLNRHIKYVHVLCGKRKQPKPKRKQCPKCEKTFQQKFALENHITVVHEGKIPYVCPQCGKGFKNAQGLKGHIITIHEKSKSFLCSLCPSSYLMKSALDLHMRTVHEKIKPCLCPQCGKNFPTQGGVNYHVKRVHDKDPNAVSISVCKMCQEEFKSKYELNNHKLIVHGD